MGREYQPTALTSTLAIPAFFLDRNDVNGVNRRNAVILADYNDHTLADGEEFRMGNSEPPTIGEPQLERFEPVRNPLFDLIIVHLSDNLYCKSHEGPSQLVQALFFSFVFCDL